MNPADPAPALNPAHPEPVEGPTGPDLADRLRDAAKASGQSTKDFLRPLFGSFVSSGLLDLQRAARPKPATVARIEAFLAGEPIPPRRSYRRSGLVAQHRDSRASRIVRDLRTDPARIPPTLDRTPCIFCGTRADFGCKHRPASQPEMIA